MTPVGRGTRRSGLYTGLQIGQQFANAVLHFLRQHKAATRRATGAIELPIDEKTWQEVFKLEYPNIKPSGAGSMQSLRDYCDYYNGGTHGLGYDQDENMDFGTGRRTGPQRKGSSINGTNKTVHPGSGSQLSAMQIIAIVKKHAHEIPRNESRSVGRTIGLNPARLRMPRANSPIELQSHEADISEFEAEGPFDPQDGDNRELVERQIRQRRGQQKFRDALRKRYGNRCLITGCDVLDVLEAAHIKPYRGEADNHPENGLLLRADVHTLLDLDLIGIEPDEMRVELHPLLAKDEHYKTLAGKKLHCKPARGPSQRQLKLKYERFKARLES